MRWIVSGAVCLVSLAAPTAAWAQTCPLCYRAAAASKAGALAALRSGVLILMIPPVIIFGLVTLMAVRGRDRFNEVEDVAPAEKEREPELLEVLEEEDRAWN
jgi:hypothetical protein